MSDNKLSIDKYNVGYQYGETINILNPNNVQSNLGAIMVAETQVDNGEIKRDIYVQGKHIAGGYGVDTEYDYLKLKNIIANYIYCDLLPFDSSLIKPNTYYFEYHGVEKNIIYINDNLEKIPIQHLYNVKGKIFYIHDNAYFFDGYSIRLLGDIPKNLDYEEKDYELKGYIEANENLINNLSANLNIIKHYISGNIEYLTTELTVNKNTFSTGIKDLNTRLDEFYTNQQIFNDTYTEYFDELKTITGHDITKLYSITDTLTQDISNINQDINVISGNIYLLNDNVFNLTNKVIKNERNISSLENKTSGYISTELGKANEKIDSLTTQVSSNTETIESYNKQVQGDLFKEIIRATSAEELINKRIESINGISGILGLLDLQDQLSGLVLSLTAYGDQISGSMAEMNKFINDIYENGKLSMYFNPNSNLTDDTYNGEALGGIGVNKYNVAKLKTMTLSEILCEALFPSEIPDILLPRLSLNKLYTFYWGESVPEFTFDQLFEVHKGYISNGSHQTLGWKDYKIGMTSKLNQNGSKFGINFKAIVDTKYCLTGSLSYSNGVQVYDNHNVLLTKDHQFIGQYLNENNYLKDDIAYYNVQFDIKQPTLPTIKNPKIALNKNIMYFKVGTTPDVVDAQIGKMINYTDGSILIGNTSMGNFGKPIDFDTSNNWIKNSNGKEITDCFNDKGEYSKIVYQNIGEGSRIYALGNDKILILNTDSFNIDYLTLSLKLNEDNKLMPMQVSCGVAVRIYYPYYIKNYNELTSSQILPVATWKEIDDVESDYNNLGVTIERTININEKYESTWKFRPSIAVPQGRITADNTQFMIFTLLAGYVEDINVGWLKKGNMYYVFSKVNEKPLQDTKPANGVEGVDYITYDIWLRNATTATLSPYKIQICINN